MRNQASSASLLLSRFVLDLTFREESTLEYILCSMLWKEEGDRGPSVGLAGPGASDVDK